MTNIERKQTDITVKKKYTLVTSELFYIFKWSGGRPFSGSSSFSPFVNKNKLCLAFRSHHTFLYPFVLIITRGDGLMGMPRSIRGAVKLPFILSAKEEKFWNN